MAGKVARVASAALMLAIGFWAAAALNAGAASPYPALPNLCNAIPSSALTTALGRPESGMETMSQPGTASRDPIPPAPRPPDIAGDGPAGAIPPAPSPK
jgi:hypothetical protein